MNANEFRNKIDEMTSLIAATIPKAENEADKQMVVAMALGLQIVGEFLLDMKRLADAAAERAHLDAGGWPTR